MSIVYEKSTSTTIADLETGLVKKQESSVEQRFKQDEPAYIKIYLQDILYLSQIPPKHSEILYELLKRSTYADMANDMSGVPGLTTTVNKSVKTLIAKKLNRKSIGSIDNALTDLVKGKILIRVMPGIYMFNPYLFGKGHWKDIKNLRLQVDYCFNRDSNFKDELQSKREFKLVEYTEENGQTKQRFALIDNTGLATLKNTTSDLIDVLLNLELTTNTEQLKALKQDHFVKEAKLKKVLQELDIKVQEPFTIDNLQSLQTLEVFNQIQEH